MSEKKIEGFFLYVILKSNEMKMQNETEEEIGRRWFFFKKME